MTVTMLITTRKAYTPEGIIRLSKVLKATLGYNRWSEREFARQAGISHGSANRYINGRILMPQDDILKAIAPHIYVAISITPDGVEIDPAKTYGENWIALENIVLNDNLQTYQQSTDMEKLQNLISDYIHQERITEEEFARRALLHPIVIREIYRGKILGEAEVILSLIASILPNPDTAQTFTSWVELAQYCGFSVQKKSAPENSGQNHVNSL